jgi:hypothetical protein
VSQADDPRTPRVVQDRSEEVTMDATVEALRLLSQSRLLDEITESVRKRSRPNIFRVFPRALRVESLHSDVLRWLLDPHGWHELGDCCGTPLLRQFLKRSHPPKEKEDDGPTSDAEIAIDAADAEIPVGGGTIDIVRSIIRSHVMGRDDEITKQCWALFDGHREAWRAIRARLPSERDEAHKLLGDVCCSQFARRFGGEWMAAARHDKYATLSRPSWRTAFGDWKGAPLVTFSEAETPQAIAALHFRLALEVGDDDKGQAPPTLAVRIKCDTRSLRKTSEARQESLVAELREVFGEVKASSPLVLVSGS